MHKNIPKTMLTLGIKMHYLVLVFGQSLNFRINSSPLHISWKLFKFWRVINIKQFVLKWYLDLKKCIDLFFIYLFFFRLASYFLKVKIDLVSLFLDKNYSGKQYFTNSCKTLLCHKYEISWFLFLTCCIRILQ